MISALLPAWLVGVTTFLVMLIVLLFWGLLFFVPVMLLKLFIPIPVVRDFLSKVLAAIATQWVASNRLVFRILHAPQWRIDDNARLDPNQSYLLISNHQSWADILILFDLLHGRTPFLRFFLKKQLIWVPLVGVICWALDMPFLQRSSSKSGVATPRVRERDLAATRGFCEKFRGKPITVVNFVEGTRHTQAKRLAQNSELHHLLRPKSAGISFTLNAMGDQFAGIIDVTLAYQETGAPLLWSWLCGRQNHMSIHVDTLPIPPEMLSGDYDHDPKFREHFQNWLKAIWLRKDARLERMHGGAAASQPHIHTT